MSLVPRLASDPDARATYVDLLRSLVSVDDSADDDGAAAFSVADAEDLFAAMDGPVSAPGAAIGGAAIGGGAIGGGADDRGADNGGAAGVLDRLDGVIAAARRLANLTTYLQMKSRAGTVGANGLAPMIQRVRAEHRDVRVHLVGHSFGWRLETAAAHALEDNTPQVRGSACCRRRSRTTGFRRLQRREGRRITRSCPRRPWRAIPSRSTLRL
ncbi:hypothetical protein [Nocardia sp. NPDC057272]|uniref:hypothetical protein n=1 Tax=Nocardia sp. NPDC057272 TaxID=3346079 RepID=UPI00363E4895